MPTENTNTETKPAESEEAKTAAAAKTAKTAATAGEVSPEAALSTDINQMISKARADEKQKQYGKIERLEAAESAGQARISELQEQLAGLLKKQNGEAPAATKKKEGEEAPAATGLSQEQLDRAITAAASATLERAEKEIFGPRIASLESALKEAKAQQDARDVGDYKNRLLEENKGSIIPELIQGTSPEELDTSLVIAKQVFARTAATLTNLQQNATASADGKIPATPKVNGNTASVTPDSSVRTMDNKQYAADRQRLLAEVSKAAKAALNG